MANVKESLPMKEDLAVQVNPPVGGLSPLAGMAVLVCLACGKIGTPYAASAKRPTDLPCHPGHSRDDYAPSVRVVFNGTDRVAIAGEPMAHARARLAKA